MTQLKPAAFFDRDGVINRDHGYVSHPDKFELVEGAARALALCREAGYFIFVVTNQAGVAHGYYQEEAIAALHRHMTTLLEDQGAAIDDIRYCPHHPDARLDAYRKDCSWRKPGPGMILDLAAHWPVDLRHSFLIGDKQSDMEAAMAAGIRGFRFNQDQQGPLDQFVTGVISQMRQEAMP
jgi:D-glycero-D-manno-heptose 1,7-bisphosphate phosphatase